MKFLIPCRTFARLAKAALPDDREDGAQPYAGIRGVRIEHQGGKALAIATNRDFLVCEYIGETTEPDGMINISAKLATICERFAETDHNLLVTKAPGWSVAQIGVEYFHPENAEIGPEFPDWRKLVPTEKVAKSSGAIAFDPSILQFMAEVTPSGHFVLPTLFDAEQAIIVRDLKDDHWFGLFLSLEHRNQSFKPASVPGWFQK